MLGYFKNELASADAFTNDGWLRTGDIALINAQGFVKIVDRLKDMVLVSGFNVYPNEVEEVIASHPQVLEVGVIGVKDEHSGETVKAFVVKKDDSLTEEALHAFCHQQLSAYKCPKQIAFLEHLPKSNVGKILRKELRKL